MNKKKSLAPAAAALKYDGVNTPKLVAKGQGILAQEIIAKAREHDVHIHNDPLLLEVLSRLELGDEIPRSLYLAVAKIIAFAYFIQGKHPDYRPDEGAALDNAACLPVTESPSDMPLK
jgi:flagellar biosynthesis protein